MSRKYDIRICKCGRIHAIPNERIEKALDADKNFLLICAACGNATLIGADISPDWDDPSKDCYEMYSADFSSYEDKVINTDTFKENEKEKAVEEIFYSHGIKVIRTDRVKKDLNVLYCSLKSYFYMTKNCMVMDRINIRVQMCLMQELIAAQKLCIRIGYL